MMGVNQIPQLGQLEQVGRREDQALVPKWLPWYLAEAEAHPSLVKQVSEINKCSRIIEVSEKKLFSCGPIIQSLVSTMKYCKISTLEFCFAHCVVL